jgi:hypothetical protein
MLDYIKYPYNYSHLIHLQCNTVSLMVRHKALNTLTINTIGRDTSSTPLNHSEMESLPEQNLNLLHPVVCNDLI